MQSDAKKTKKPGPLSIPSYRLRKGYNEAIVTLRDAQTGRAKDYWLGELKTSPFFFSGRVT